MKGMQATRIEATVTDGGRLELADLPFAAGERVEVIVLPAHPAAHPRPREFFRGTVLHYERPFDPVVDAEEWNAVDDPDSVGDPSR
jgi:hypothetical protein